MHSYFNGGNASIYVYSMDKAIDFYTNILGLKLISRIGNEWAEIEAGSGFIIGLHPSNTEGIQPGVAGSINIELKLERSHNIIDVVDILKQKGVSFKGEINHYEHVSIASIIDPDKNTILIAQQK